MSLLRVLSSAVLCSLLASCAGGGADPAAPCGFDPTWVHDENGARLQLASPDGLTCLRVDRRDLSEPGFVYFARPWALVGVLAAHGSARWAVSDPDKLHWESTHHNWGDWATAEIDDGALHLDTQYDVDEGRVRYWLQQLAPGGDDVVWGPEELEPAAVLNPRDRQAPGPAWSAFPPVEGQTLQGRPAQAGPHL